MPISGGFLQEMTGLSRQKESTANASMSIPLSESLSYKPVRGRNPFLPHWPKSKRQLSNKLPPKSLSQKLEDRRRACY